MGQGADGTITIDTRVDKSGIKGGLKDIQDSLNRIAVTVENIAKSMGTMGKACADGMDSASHSVDDFQKKTEEAKKAADDMSHLKISRWNDDSQKNDYDGPLRKPEPVDTRSAEVWAEKAKEVEQSMDKASRNSEGFKGQIQALKEELKSMEKSGKWWGDNKYDETALKLERMQQEAKEYKKELFSPAENANPFGLDTLAGKVRAAELELQRLANAGKGLGDADYDTAYTKLAQLTQEAKEYKKELAGSSGKIRNNNAQLGAGNKKISVANRLANRVAQTVKKISDYMASGGIQNSGRSLTKGFSGALKTLMKYALGIRSLYILVNKFRSATVEGFKNLAQYSDETNASISMVLSSLTRLKNSFATAFAPILTVVVPILSSFIDMLSRAVTYVGMFFAALTGKSSFTKAVAVQQNYADSLKETADAAEDTADATDDAKKASEGYLSAIDTIHKYSDGSDKGNDTGKSKTSTPNTGKTGLTPGDMFETVPIENSAKDLAARMKKIFGQIFTPFKQAWQQEGANTVKVAKYALNSLGKLARSVGKSFLEVWTNGTGTKTLSLMLKIAQNILNTIGNIASRLNEAWNKNQTGTKIVQNLFDLFNIILGVIEKITGATAKWAKTLDFSPLLTSINTLLEALKPITQTIGSGLAWLYENVLLPIAGWTIQKALPEFLNMVAAGLGVLNSVITALQPLGLWLWNSFLQPLGQWTGGVIIAALQTITGLFTTAGNWITEHQEAVQNFVIVLGSFATAWGVVKAAMLAWNVVCGISTGLTTALGAAVALLTSPFGIAVVAIGAVIAVGVLLYKNWDKICAGATKLKTWVTEKTRKLKEDATKEFSILKINIKNAMEAIGTSVQKKWEAIKTFFAGFSTWLGDVFNTDWTKWFGIFGNILNAFCQNVKNVVRDIRKVFNGLIKMITGVFSGNWKQAWEGIKDIFKGVFDGRVDLAKAPINNIIATFNGVLDVVNGMIKAINSISFKITIPSWIPGIGGNWWGFNGFNIPTIGNIPYLAKGAVIPPRSEFMAVLGDQKNGTNIETPEKLLRKIFREEIGNSAQNRGNNVYKVSVEVSGRKLLDFVIDEGELRQKRNGGKNPFALGGA